MLLSMLMPSGIKMALYGALVVAAGAAYWHYATVKSERNDALAAVGALQVAKEIQDDTIHKLQAGVIAWQKAAEKQQETLAALAEAQQDAAQYQKELNDVLNRDLDRISAGKPSMLERRINRGTAHVLGMFECATGGCNDDTD